MLMRPFMLVFCKNYKTSIRGFVLITMKQLLDQSFFRLLSECSQRKVSASELTEAIEELATHVANLGINEQDYSVLLRYFSFGLHRLKSFRVRFEQEKNTLFALD